MHNYLLKNTTILLKDSGFEADTEHGAWYTMDEARKAAIKAFDKQINEK